MLASKEMGAFYHLLASEDAETEPPVENGGYQEQVGEHASKAGI